MGYPPTPQAGGKEIKVDHDALEDIVKKLEKNLHALESKQFIQKIEDATPSEGAIGNYKAGQGLNNTIRAARNSIGDTYDQLIKSYKQVIEAIQNSEKTHRKADDASKHGVQSAGSPQTYI
ncbi:hypothetical protein E1264_39445 [Actinomadura sp. KC216]|uniref:hypothetical protein n=1 Tax=Actinomadura sp. KC216 TaxID=2530370 RepID=UPI00104C3165|nr:hypothetical protein [Actinomadura sp. KC216]TDB75717.1 hypothetical protein E1264_39445 [Actinomadura sp. KC216]